MCFVSLCVCEAYLHRFIITLWITDMEYTRIHCVDRTIQGRKTEIIRSNFTHKWTNKQNDEQKNVNRDIFMWIFYMITLRTKKKRVESESEKERWNAREWRRDKKSWWIYKQQKKKNKRRLHAYTNRKEVRATKDTNIRSIEKQRTICVSRTFSSYICGFLLLVTHSRLREPFNSIRFNCLWYISSNNNESFIILWLPFFLCYLPHRAQWACFVFFCFLCTALLLFATIFFSRCSVVDSFCQL